MDAFGLTLAFARLEGPGNALCDSEAKEGRRGEEDAGGVPQGLMSGVRMS